MADKHNTTKYADLDKLSTDALKEIIRADLMFDDLDDDYVMRALEVIEQREARAGNTVDVDAAWKTFCSEYWTEEGTGQSLYDSSEPCDPVPAEEKQGTHKRPKVPHFVLTRMGLVAAVMALLLAGMVTVQAAGIDIFGAIAQWGKELFHFEISKVQEQEWRSNLVGDKIPLDLLPTWIPDGFTLTDSGMDDFDTWTATWMIFTSEDGRSFNLQITVYTSPEYVSAALYQKDDSLVDEYQSNGRTVYLFANLDQYIAVCLDGLTEISAVGDLTTVELKQIFNSIGGTL